MAQLRALIWAKWCIFLRQVRTPGELAGRLLLWFFAGLVLLISILFGIGLSIWLLQTIRSGTPALGQIPLSIGLLLFLGSIYLVWMMAAFLPTRAGGSLDPSVLLHYPIALHRLFFLDLVTEPIKGLPVLLFPSLAALSLTPAFAIGKLYLGLAPLLLTLVFGTVAAKTLESLVGLVNRRGRHVGEGLATAANLVIIVLTMASIAAAPRLQYMLLHAHGFWAGLLRATPLVLVANSLAALARDDMTTYWRLLAGFTAYIPFLGAICYFLWKRLATGAETAPRKTARPPLSGRMWDLAGLSDTQNALLEKEMKYQLRNPQVRMLLTLPFAFLLFKFSKFANLEQANDAPSPSQLEHLETLFTSQWTPYLGGFLTVCALAYLLLLYCSILNNLFGSDGHGMKRYLLVPVPARTVLLMKNLSTATLIAIQGIILLGVNQIIFRDLTIESIAVGVLAFLTATPLLAGVGNFVSLRFPRESPYGKRLEASPWAVLLMFLEVPLGLSPVLIAFGAGILAQSNPLKHALLLLGACVATGLYYFLLLPEAANMLKRRASIIAHEVTGGHV